MNQCIFLEVLERRDYTIKESAKRKRKVQKEKQVKRVTLLSDPHPTESRYLHVAFVINSLIFYGETKK